MFHEGDLQSGITAAIQQGKPVACFVRDSGDDSETWETSWLADQRVAPLAASRAILLKIRAKTEEAGFLSAFCRIPRVPALVIIENGKLVENVAVGVGKSEFVDRVRKALGGLEAETEVEKEEEEPPPREQATQEQAPQVEEPHQPAPQVETPQAPSGVSRHATVEDDEPESAASLPSSSAAAAPATVTPTPPPASAPSPAPAQSRSSEYVYGHQPPPSRAPARDSSSTTRNGTSPARNTTAPARRPTPSSRGSSSSRSLTPHDNLPAARFPSRSPSRPVNLRDLLPERSARFEAEYETRQQAEEAARAAKRKGKGKAVDEDDYDEEFLEEEDPAIAEARIRAAEARANKRADKVELKRVLATIEHDKIERRLREQKKRDSMKMSLLSESPALKSDAAKARAARSRNFDGDVTLQIRLFDGRMLRTAFPASATPENEVRAYLDAHPALIESDAAAAGRFSSSTSASTSTPTSASTSSSPTALSFFSRTKVPPYSLKHLNPPQPGRKLLPADESLTLAQLGLAPAATLVLVPATAYSSAYTSGYDVGALARTDSLLAWLWKILLAAFAWLAAPFRNRSGDNDGQQQQRGAAGRRRIDGRASATPEPEASGEGEAGGSGSGTGAQAAGAQARKRVRTLADQRAAEREKGGGGEGKAQLYNGNQLNFESRDDDEKDE